MKQKRHSSGIPEGWARESCGFPVGGFLPVGSQWFTCGCIVNVPTDLPHHTHVLPVVIMNEINLSLQKKKHLWLQRQNICEHHAEFTMSTKLIILCALYILIMHQNIFTFATTSCCFFLQSQINLVHYDDGKDVLIHNDAHTYIHTINGP